MSMSDQTTAFFVIIVALAALAYAAAWYSDLIQYGPLF